MAKIHIRSVEEPFDRPELGRAATEMLALADAMGLLGDGTEIRSLGWQALRDAVARVARAGVATALAPRLAAATDPEEAADLLHTQGRAPAEILAGAWDPDDTGPLEVLRLARSLSDLASP